MFSSLGSADISDDLFKCSHFYGNTSEASQLFTHKESERDRDRSVLCGCVSGKLREHKYSCISQKPKKDRTPQIFSTKISSKLKPNTPCSCKQPMQGTKLQKAQFHALMLSEVCQKGIHNAISCCNIVLQWALFIVNKMTTFVNEQQFEENLAQSQS